MRPVKDRQPGSEGSEGSEGKSIAADPPQNRSVMSTTGTSLVAAAWSIGSWSAGSWARASGVVHGSASSMCCATHCGTFTSAETGKSRSATTCLPASCSGFRTGLEVHCGHRAPRGVARRVGGGVVRVDDRLDVRRPQVLLTEAPHVAQLFTTAFAASQIPRSQPPLRHRHPLSKCSSTRGRCVSLSHRPNFLAASPRTRHLRGAISVTT